jgi:[ribosomal protein S18]-alanine N-acetyltransferase
MAVSKIATSGSRVTISAMTEHDLLEVVQIEELSQLSTWGWDAYHKELQSPEDVIMLVARVEQSEGTSNPDQKLAGFIVSRLVADELHINNVALRPEFRRRGIATLLLDSVLSAGRGKAARTAFLEVREGNTAAQRLYLRCGFRVTGRRKLYYHDPVEDALLMALFWETSP